VSSGGGKVLVDERRDWRVVSAEGYCGWKGWLASSREGNSVERFGRGVARTSARVVRWCVYSGIEIGVIQLHVGTTVGFLV